MVVNIKEIMRVYGQLIKTLLGGSQNNQIFSLTYTCPHSIQLISQQIEIRCPLYIN